MAKPALIYAAISAAFLLFKPIPKLGFAWSMVLFASILSLFVFMDFKLVQLSYLLVLVGILIWEHYAPRHRWENREEETTQNVATIFLKRSGVLAIYVALTYIGFFEYKPTWGVGQLPVFVQAILALLILDLKDYLIHVGRHKYSWWWKYHRTHHLTRRLDVLAHGRIHVGEFILVPIFTNILVIHFMGFGFEALLYGYYLPGNLIASLWSHANIDYPKNKLPFWAYVIATPNVHALHHTRESDRVNFGGVLVIWDVLFGTFKAPTSDMLHAEAFGVDGHDEPISFTKEQAF